MGPDRFCMVSHHAPHMCHGCSAAGEQPSGLMSMKALEVSLLDSPISDVAAYRKIAPQKKPNPLESLL